MRGNPCTEDSISDLVALLISVVESVTAGRYRNMFDTADDLVVRTDAFEARLQDVAGGATSWAEAIDDYEAADAVPLLTIHRSKRVGVPHRLLLGLDNEQLWAHKRDIQGPASTFFVGLSRAAQRVIFTQCDHRGTKITSRSYARSSKTRLTNTTIRRAAPLVARSRISDVLEKYRSQFDRLHHQCGLAIHARAESVCRAESIPPLDDL